MHEKVAVVIPIYKEEFSPLELISLEQEQKVLGKYPLIFIAPEGKKLPPLPEGSQVIRFPAPFFEGVAGYSRLLLQPAFYQAFFGYDYMLLHQLDAFVFSDQLAHFCRLGYDYIGAPWPYMWGRHVFHGKRVFLPAGNGGFCLRSPRACHRLLLAHPEAARDWPGIGGGEDVFFAYYGQRKKSRFRVAPLSVARAFSMEFHPERCVRKNGGNLPFGCHAWYRYSPDFYVGLLAKFGYDISPYRDRMKEDDFMALRFFLQNTAWNRLLRNIRRGASVRVSLPRTEYQSFRVIRSPRALHLLAILAAIGEQPMARECYFYENQEGLQLIRDMKQAGGCHLLLTEGDDGAFLRRMEQDGLRYGEHVVSFYQEYMRSQQELLHRMGK